MKKIFKSLALTAMVSASFFGGHANASVVIEGTRVIFPAQEREVTIKLTNNGAKPALVQTWLDNGDAQIAPDKIDVPFTLTPSMFRLDPNKGQTLRLIYTREPLATDKETMFWLNMLEVPPKVTGSAAASSHIQMAFRTRIKVLFRPKGLSGEAIDAPGKTTWELVPGKDSQSVALKATNASPYFVNLGKITVKVNGKDYDADSGFVPPHGTQLFPVSGLTAQPGVGGEVDYVSINDFGGGVQGKQVLSAPSTK